VSLVLVVDDNDDIREMLSLFLEEAGHAVVTAHHGREALRLFGHGLRPDLVVLDLMMPVMSGWELRQEMLRDPEVASIPTVVITGDRAWSRRSEELHAVAALSKPFEPEEILALIEKVKREPGPP
jgi:CheY-like chemotaxis protein